MARTSRTIINIETASASQAQHPMAFVPFVPSVTTILQEDTFNSQHVSQYTPHLNYCLIWDNSQHVSQYTPHVKYCLRRSMSRGKQMMCRLHSRHSQWLRMRQSMTNGITLVNLFLRTWCVAVIVCIRFNSFVCIFHRKKRCFHRNYKTYHFITCRFYFRRSIHALSFFVVCLLITWKNSISRNLQDVPLHLFYRMFCLKSPWIIFVFVRFKLSKCLVVCLFITSFVQSWFPVAHLVGICVPPQFLHRPNSLALCTGRSVFNQSATTIWMPLHPRMRARTF